MGKRKLNSKTKYVSLILVFALVAISCLSWITYAWFTDRKDFSGNLTFGTVELDVSGTGVDNTTKKLKFSTTRNDSTWTGNIMPGDTINIPLTISLTSTSEDAYYIVQISDDKNIFENAYYYSQNGTDVYVNNGSTITKQGTTTTVTSPVVGKLLKGTSGHNITIGAKISEDFEQKGISTTIECNIYAIQVANLTEADAYILLNKEATTVAHFITGWQSAIANVANFTTIGFYEKGSQPATTTFNSELTTSYNNAVTNEADKNLIEVYTNGTTELAFVSEYKIYAPENCKYLFGWNIPLGIGFLKCEIFEFENFYTNKVTDMSSMFYTNRNVKSIDLSNFNTENVETMSSMFKACGDSLTSLDLSSFNTTKVSDFDDMLGNCNGLTRVDIPLKFTNKGTAFTKATLCETTGLSTSVAVYRDGELLA